MDCSSVIADRADRQLGQLVRTPKRCQRLPIPANSCAPRSQNSKPEPATKSLTVLEIKTSPGLALVMMAAPIETAMPLSLSPMSSHSPVCTPDLRSMLSFAAAFLSPTAHRIARPGPSNLATRRLPALSTSTALNFCNSTSINAWYLLRVGVASSEATGPWDFTVSAKSMVVRKRSVSTGVRFAVMNRSISAQMRSNSGPGMECVLPGHSTKRAQGCAPQGLGRRGRLRPDHPFGSSRA